MVLSVNLNVVKKSRKYLSVAGKKVGVEVNAAKTKYTFMSHE
jgi:hypothetical protein